MSRERLYLFDTTLRDGAQTNGVDFTLHDKLTIARLLDELGIDYVEGGYPGANPTDTDVLRRSRKLGATFTAFGMTRRPGRSASNDPGLATLLDAKADAICFVAKSLGLSRARRARDDATEENLASIRDSVTRGQGEGPRGDGRLRAFLRRLQGQSATTRWPARKAAYEAGARWVVLCDTNGGTLPHEVEAIVARGREAHSRRSSRHPCP